MRRYHLDTVDSTNTWLKQRWADLCPGEAVLLTADSQTAGRGRYDRVWHSPPGDNIYASFGVPLLHDVEWLTQLLALAVCDLLLERGVEAHIKWPNDVLVQGKKIAGILAEKIELGLVIGLGLNINLSREACQSIDQPATSLRVETGECWDAGPLVEELSERYQELIEADMQETTARVQERRYRRGQGAV
jgi:BirA family biotin operon repressor/biotin-[acetyl-CoA-carboxylase] ligase